MSSADTHDTQIPHGTRKSYMTGFVLSVILTAIPFILVMSGGFSSPRVTGMTILIFAVVQIIVHMIYFLHMSLKAEGGWLLTSLVFTIVLLVIAIVGTMWVMYNMDYYMMPGM